jgi:hypothetical protein
VGVVCGILGLAAAGYMSARSAADVRAYAASPSCQAGFASVDRADGLCRLAPARITYMRITGKGRTETLGLRFADGTTRYTTVARNVYGQLWSAARKRVALDATAQFDGDAIVQVETAAGRIETGNYPRVALRKWAMLGIISGGIATIFALVGAFRGFY